MITFSLPTSQFSQLLESPGVKKIMEIFHQHTIPIRFVGGCVRDTLCQKPFTDIDLATPLHPEKVINLLSDHGLKVIPTGIAHGTVTALFEKNALEITTLRKDIACDGRHAIVQFTDEWEADAKRRDFTFNALSCDHTGVIYDYFGGIDDLHHGLVRFVGDPEKRIQEDALRILRFFRFHAWYGKKERCEETGRTACAANAPLLEHLSGERIQQEMEKLLSAPDPRACLKEMSACNLFPILLLETSLRLVNLLIMLELQLNLTITARRRLLCLCSETPVKDAILALAKRWRLSNLDTEYLLTLGLLPRSLDPHAPTAEWKALFRILGQQKGKDFFLLCWAEALLQGKEIDFDTAKLLLSELESWNPPPFPLKGADLLTSGYPPGPLIKEMLTFAEKHWEIHHYLLDKEALIEAIQKHFSS